MAKEKNVKNIKKEKAKIRLIVYLILLTVIVSLSLSLGILFNNKDEGDVDQTLASKHDVSKTEPPSSSKPEIVKEPTSVRLMGVGDNLIHTSIYNQARQRAGGKGYDFNYAYENIQEIISLADIASINQETIMSNVHEVSSYPQFNSPIELGNHMRKIGFSVFNQATNHTFDKYEKGVLATLDFWSEDKEAAVVGVYKNKEDYNKIRTITKNDISFAFIGMTESTNGITIPNDSDVVLMRTPTYDQYCVGKGFTKDEWNKRNELLIKERIEKAKEISDVVVINVHWGQEYTFNQNQLQKDLAKKMVEWGADVILGHHPHVIQPVEYIQREDGTKGIVAYSLGNFISAQDRGARMLGGLLDVTFTKDYKENKVTITQSRFVPIVTHYDQNFRNIRNYPLSSYTPELANKHGVKSNSPEFSMEYLVSTVNNVINKEFLTPYK